MSALAFGSVAMKKAEQSQHDGFALTLLALGFARRHRGDARFHESRLCRLSLNPLHAFRRAGYIESLHGFRLRKAASRSKEKGRRFFHARSCARARRPRQRAENQLA